jgi:hypothetical protein
MSSDPASSDKFNLASIPGLPDETLPVLQNLWDQPNEDPEKLAQRVNAHVNAFVNLAKRNEFVDPQEARDVAATCLRLLDELRSDTPPLHRKLIELAALYFVLEEDADSDFDIGGLDDDIAVVQAIASFLDAN